MKKIKYMKERFKMIFDRIDILVVCIVFWCFLTVAVAYMGFWKEFAQCIVMTFLITEVCYTNRCNEKLKKELIETKDKLNEAEKESDTAIHQIVENSRTIRFYVLLEMLWREKWTCEHAKVNYCKYKITLEELVSVMNRTDKEISEISNKISELTKDLNELYAKK